jgi:hypothetical protein
MIFMFSTLYTALINCYSNSTERNGSRKNNNGDEAKSVFDFFFFVFSVHWSTIAWKSLESVTRGPSCCGNFAEDLHSAGRKMILIDVLYII